MPVYVTCALRFESEDCYYESQSHTYFYCLEYPPMLAMNTFCLVNIVNEIFAQTNGDDCLELVSRNPDSRQWADLFYKRNGFVLTDVERQSRDVVKFCSQILKYDTKCCVQIPDGLAKSVYSLFDSTEVDSVLSIYSHVFNHPGRAHVSKLITLMSNKAKLLDKLPLLVNQQ